MMMSWEVGMKVFVVHRGPQGKDCFDPDMDYLVVSNIECRELHIIFLPTLNVSAMTPGTFKNGISVC